MKDIISYIWIGLSILEVALLIYVLYKHVEYDNKRYKKQ